MRPFTVAAAAFDARQLFYDAVIFVIAGNVENLYRIVVAKCL